MQRVEPLISVQNLEVVYRRGKNCFRAVENISFDIMPGEIFGLVGESGSGKTTIGNAIMGLVPPTKGEILLNGQPIPRQSSLAGRKQLAKRIQMIFQDPISSVNSRAKVYDIVQEGLRNLYPEMSAAERNSCVTEALADVGLGGEYGNLFPYALSGGQLQRVGIARAMIMQPDLIVADEPVSALDVSLRSQILRLMLDLREKHKLTYLLIAHDLSVMRQVCNRIGIIKSGRLVELGKTEMIFDNPVHPYTKSLLTAIPVPNPDIEKSRRYDFSEDNVLGGQWTEVECGHFVLDDIWY